MSDWFLTYGFGDVHERLLIGAVPLDARDVAMIARLGVDRILNLVEDDEYEHYRPGARDTVADAIAQAGIEERRVSVVDFGQLPPDKLEAAVSTIDGWLSEGHTVYAHCRAGWQRSASVASGVVAIREGVDVEEAMRRVNQRKPSADPLPHQRDDLRTWWEARSPDAA